MKILICQLKSHGDIVRTFPTIDAIKHYNPEAEIALTCIHGYENVASLCRHIDEVIPQPTLKAVENHRNHSRIGDVEPLRQVATTVAAKRFDYYLDMHGVFQSSLFGALVGIPVRIGRSFHTTKDGADLFYTHVSEITNKRINKMERNLLTAQSYFRHIHYVPTKPYLRRKPNRVTIVPGSSTVGIQKRWPAEHYRELIQALSNNYLVDVLFGPEERLLVDEIELSTLGANVHGQMVDNWQGYFECFTYSCFVIGNDNAALHIAIWQGVKTFSLFGPTDAVISSTWKYNAGKGITSHHACRCKSPWQGFCEHEKICMQSLLPQQVLREITEYNLQEQST